MMMCDCVQAKTRYSTPWTPVLPLLTLPMASTHTHLSSLEAHTLNPALGGLA